MNLYSDSKSAISIAHNHVHHDTTKKVEIDRQFIKETVEGNQSIRTKFQEADFSVRLCPKRDLSSL